MSGRLVLALVFCVISIGGGSCVSVSGTRTPMRYRGMRSETNRAYMSKFAIRVVITVSFVENATNLAPGFGVSSQRDSFLGLLVT